MAAEDAVLKLVNFVFNFIAYNIFIHCITFLGLLCRLVAS